MKKRFEEYLLTVNGLVDGDVGDALEFINDLQDSQEQEFMGDSLKTELEMIIYRIESAGKLSSEEDFDVELFKQYQKFIEIQSGEKKIYIGDDNMEEALNPDFSSELQGMVDSMFQDNQDHPAIDPHNFYESKP
mmetsp:Transcript_16081/g.27151  ORF Transcript_16081/g.27151 Transcript_16081/m.27151 type:complete len:134 (-) Transcript_16081:215-616(-)|eukprot:CAMPEP_0168611512 /NCGR_PEP_ID=MMETSP0449_2-20121227/2400_1 /TAXON_ID=1082188 /ORGANISM="Strombidium rassoulzadegani, Strain ras09" /LENGTH=133 /DNA_ID=CAMNT_0008651969 /DNA_START=824 /DNA_END=1225 /DNA_ORIENTATION=-